MEAFSFRKSVVKIDGRWLGFGRELEGAIRDLSVGDRVGYMTEGRNLKRIQRMESSVSPTASQLKIEKQQPPRVPVVASGAETMPAIPATMDNRNRSIERQVALKAAVELAELFGYKTTNQCLDVAANFAAWIEGSVTTAAAGKAAASEPTAYLF